MKNKLLRHRFVALGLALVMCLTMVTPAFASDYSEVENATSQTIMVDGESVTISYDSENPTSIVVNGLLFERIGSDIYCEGEVVASVSINPGISPCTGWIYSETSPYNDSDFSTDMAGEDTYNLVARERIMNISIASLVGIIALGISKLGELPEVLAIVATAIATEAHVDLTFGNSEIVYAHEEWFNHNFVPFTRLNQFKFYKDAGCRNMVPGTAKTLYSCWA